MLPNTSLMLKRWWLTVYRLDIVLLLSLRMMVMTVNLLLIQLFDHVSCRAQDVQLIVGCSFPRGVLRWSHNLSIHFHYYVREGSCLQTRPAIFGYYLQREWYGSIVKSYINSISFFYFIDRDRKGSAIEVETAWVIVLSIINIVKYKDIF